MDTILKEISDSVANINKSLYTLYYQKKGILPSNKEKALDDAVKVINDFECNEMHVLRKALEDE